MKGWIYSWIFWTPRVLAMLFILFLMLFSLDVYSSGIGFWQLLGGLLMHNIPAFVLMIVLYFSWKYELVGAILFTLFSIAYMIMARMMFPVIYVPALLVGVLFFANWNIKRRLDDGKISKHNKNRK
jgi:hypothetical protein